MSESAHEVLKTDNVIYIIACIVGNCLVCAAVMKTGAPDDCFSNSVKYLFGIEFSIT